MTFALGLVAAYLLGSVPTSYLVARFARGVDLRAVGSGNVGATNLYRALGWRYAVPVGLFDLLKGAVPVLVFPRVVGGGPYGPLLLGAAAVVGHVFPVFLGFKGGKGVATAAGVVLGLAPWAFLAGLVVWAVTVKLSGYVSLASMLAAAVLPPAAWIFQPGRRELVGIFAALAAVVIFSHRGNLRRLANGTENRFGRRAEGPRPS